MSVSVADIFKKTYKQIDKEKCVAGGGKHVNLITNPSVGYCLCPEGQSIADSANPKCAPIDPKVPYEPFNSGFYRDGTQCKPEEGLVTQKHPFHQNFGEPACTLPTPTCASGFTKQQLRYDGEVLDYCVRKDADGKFVSSYYPTTFLMRPPAAAAPPKVEPAATSDSSIPSWVWWVGGSVVAVIILAVVWCSCISVVQEERHPLSAIHIFLFLPQQTRNATSCCVSHNSSSSCACPVCIVWPSPSTREGRQR